MEQLHVVQQEVDCHVKESNKKLCYKNNKKS